MSARTKKAPAPAGSLSDAPVGATERSPQSAPPTIEVMRVLGIEQARLWLSELAPWRDGRRDEACELVEGLDSRYELLAAWTNAFDGMVADAVAPTLTADERRILVAYQTMDGRRQGEAMRFMEAIAKEFPGAAPAAGGAAAGAASAQAALDELRGHVGDESENLAILADTLRDLLWLAIDGLMKEGGKRVDTLIRVAQRHVEDIDDIAKHLHKAEVAAKQGGAS